MLEHRAGAAARTAVMKARGGPGRRQARVSGGDLPTINSPVSGNLRMNIEHHQGFQKTLLDLSSRAKTPSSCKMHGDSFAYAFLGVALFQLADYKPARQNVTTKCQKSCTLRAI